MLFLLCFNEIDKGEWNIRRQLESTTYRTDSTATGSDPVGSATSAAPSSLATSASRTGAVGLQAAPAATLVRECLKTALDQVKSAVLRQENELVNQPAHILALIDRQMESFLKSHFRGMTRYFATAC